MEKPTWRLNKRLAALSGLSRRQADELIAQGQVTVNNQPARIGQQVSANDEIKLKGQVLNKNITITTILLNKPVGYTCSRRFQGGDQTIYDLLPPELHHLKPAGRLDKNSSGLLLMTNDGDLAFRLTHPKFHKTKTYQVTLDQDLAPLHQQMISDFGVMLDDGKSQLQLTRLSNKNRQKWQVDMHEGRNRQIRRTFAALGYQVTQLHRISFGQYSINNIPSGEYKII